ncbi:WD40-repeat-containing domain protein [Blakeslea trispora]|nr:WD40-repeat-containing domain protein [Blakeslea trispora]
MSSSQLHASVLEFLINHGYMESVEAFKREARHQLELASTEDKLVLDMSQLQIQRLNELLEGDEDYVNTTIFHLTDIHYTNMLAVAIEPKSRLIATSGIDKSVKITSLNTSDFSHNKTFRHHQAPVLSIAFHPAFPQLMLTTSMDGTSVLVDTECEPEFGQDPEKEGMLQQFKDHQKYVVQGLFSPEQGRFMATASYDRTVCIYLQQEQSNLPTYSLLKRLGPFIGNVETICFVEPTTLIIGVRDDNYLHYISLADEPQAIQSTRINMNATGDDWVSFSPVCISSLDGMVLCTTDHDSGRTILFEAGSPKQIQNYYIYPNDNKFMTRKHIWHPSGRYFYAIGSNEHTIAVVETKTGQVVETLKGHTGMIRSLVMDPVVGLVSTGYDQSVRVWSKPNHIVR